MPRTARQRPSTLHEGAWPDIFSNLHTAYAELTRAQFELQRRSTEIEETGSRFQLVIESMSEALFLVNHIGHVERTNAAAQALLDASDAELVGRPFSEVCGTDLLPGTIWEFLERASAGPVYHVEAVITSHAGRTTPVSTSCSLVRDRWGKIAGMLVVARDITERKRAEEALAEQARELARSNAELEQFAYVASHDLQEPLRMVASYAQLLAKRYEGKIDARADKYINYMVDGATRMQRLINALLQFSRVGSRAPISAPVDCSVLMNQVSKNLRSAIRESSAVIRHEELPTVLGDETLLVQLFQNLVSNAIKFRGEQPPEIDINAERRESRWLFSIRDRGIGIEPQYAQRIFVIFQRLHSQAEYPGTGIGLAICRKIVERHGGSLWFESEPGHGTTFFFDLPGAGSHQEVA